MKVKVFIVIVLCGFASYAQQEPQYTQYMYNMSMVNPGYMINELGLIQLGSLYRSQWVGIDGAPKTANIFGHIPLSDRIELSVNYLNDDIGDVFTQNKFNIDMAYKINLNEDLNLSFGIKGGINSLSFDFSNTNVVDDPLFKNETKTTIEIGAGVFLFSEKYYVGFSSPNLAPSGVDVTNTSLYKSTPHFYLIGGYVFDLSHDVKLKPSAVVKQVFGAPLSFDISTNALFYEKFEVGVSYRYQDAISGLVGINVTPSLKLGYAYDFNSSELNNFNDGSHEFILLYTFDILGLSKKYSSPRFY